MFIVIKGTHYEGSEAVYAQYMQGSVPLLQKYRVQIIGVGNGLSAEMTHETWKTNIILSFPDEASADGFFLDPDYQFIKQNYRDKAYQEIKLSLFTPVRPLEKQKEHEVCIVSLANFLPDGAIRNREYAQSVLPALLANGGSTLAIGTGIQKDYAPNFWDNAVLFNFPSLQHFQDFYHSDIYQSYIKSHRDFIYKSHCLSIFQPRTPRVSL